MNENRPSHWRKISAIAGGLGAAAGFAAFCRWQNSSLSVTTYRCGSHKLPSSFEDFVLLQVSDLHNKSFGRHQHGLLDRLAAEEPDQHRPGHGICPGCGTAGAGVLYPWQP